MWQRVTESRLEQARRERPAADSAPRRKAGVLLVDDHPLLRDGLAQLIGDAPDLMVCGQAADAAEAMLAIERLKPDLAVVDIFLPGTNGIELTKRIREVHPKVKVLILSMHDEGLYARRALRAGALGYVMKQEASKTILDGIRAVLKGERYVSRRMAEDLLGEAVGDTAKPEAQSIGQALSDRELEIFELFGHGHNRNDIACKLNVSVKTIEAHRQNIREKLRIRDATEFMRQAMQWVQSG